MFNNSEAVKQQNLQALAYMGKLSLNPITGTTYLVKKLGQFNLNLTTPTLFKSLLSTPDKLELGNLILFSPTEEKEPILCVDYEVSFSESILQTPSGIKFILDIKSEIFLVEKYYSYIKDYEAYISLKNKEDNLKKITDPLNKEASEAGIYLDGIINSLNNIIDNNKNEN